MADHFEHKTKQGERWDLLAYRYYGDADKMGIIIRANQKLWDDNEGAVPPMILPSSWTLTIPVIDVEDVIDESLLPPWKRQNAEYA